MKNIDFLSLDARSLRTFLVVLEETSISKAAARLGVTQSAVSHLLDKLRLTLGDPLFVRAGRGIVPTGRAIALREPVQSVLDGMKALTDERPFDPTIGRINYTIAANDFQRDLIFPGLVRELVSDGVDARFRFIPSGIPAANLLRNARCQLIVTPFPPEGPDIYQTWLFDDHVVCFYDGEVRSAPGSKQEFLDAEYIEVRFDDDETAMQTIQKSQGIDPDKRRLSVPNFSALAAFLKGTSLVSAQLSLLERVNLQGLETAPLPFASDIVSMYLAWHRREHLDPAHQWLRQCIKERVSEIVWAAVLLVSVVHYLQEQGGHLVVKARKAA